MHVPVNRACLLEYWQSLALQDRALVTRAQEGGFGHPASIPAV